MYGIISIMVYIKTSSILAIILSALWIITPAIMCFISKIPQISKEELTQENKEYIIDRIRNMTDDELEKINYFDEEFMEEIGQLERKLKIRL